MQRFDENVVPMKSEFEIAQQRLKDEERERHEREEVCREYCKVALKSIQLTISLFLG